MSWQAWWNRRTGTAGSESAAEEWFAKGIGAIEKGELENARHSLLRALAVEPEHADTHAVLGALLIDRGELELARKILLHGAVRWAGEARMRLLASVVLERSANIDDAMKEARAAAELQPSWPEVHEQLGRLHARKGDRAACVKAWSSAVELSEERDAEALAALGIAYSNAGRHDEAIGLLMRVAALDPGDASARADLGMALLAAGKIETASNELARAAAANAGCAQAHLGLGIVHAHRGHWQKAVHEFRVAARFAPSSDTAYFNLGLALEAIGDPEAARKAFLRAAALAPDDAEIADALRRTLQARGQSSSSSQVSASSDPRNSISGDIPTFPLPNLLEFLRLQTKSGTLMVTSRSGTGLVRLIDGRLVSASSPRSKKLGDMLVERRLLSREQFDHALLEQTSNEDQDTSMCLGSIILRNRWVSEEMLRGVISEQLIEALGEMLQWNDGSFSFQVWEPGAEPKSDFSFDVQQTVLELFRRADEGSAKARRER